MTLVQVAWFLVIGLLAGWLAGLLTKGKGFGWAGNLVVGCVGALIGGLLHRLVLVVLNSLIGSLLMATLGAVILLAVIGLLNRSRR